MVPTTYQELVLQSLGQYKEYRERVKQEAEEQVGGGEQIQIQTQIQKYKYNKIITSTIQEKKNTTNAPSAKKDIFRPYCLKDPERKTVFPPYLIKVKKEEHFESQSFYLL